MITVRSHASWQCFEPILPQTIAEISLGLKSGRGSNTSFEFGDNLIQFNLHGWLLYWHLQLSQHYILRKYWTLIECVKNSKSYYESLSVLFIIHKIHIKNQSLANLRIAVRKLKKQWIYDFRIFILSKCFMDLWNGCIFIILHTETGRFRLSFCSFSWFLYI